MNLVDAVVISLDSQPEFRDYGDITFWSVDVTYDAWGSKSGTTLTFATKEEADAVNVGYKFVC